MSEPGTTQAHGIEPDHLFLVGPWDPYAEEQLREHAPVPGAVSLEPPKVWNEQGVAEAAACSMHLFSGILEDLDDALLEHDYPGEFRPRTAALAGDEPQGVAELVRRDARSVWKRSFALGVIPLLRTPISPWTNPNWRVEGDTLSLSRSLSTGTCRPTSLPVSRPVRGSGPRGTSAHEQQTYQPSAALLIVTV